MGRLNLKLHNSCPASNEREVVCSCTHSSTYLSILDFRLVMVGTHENICPTFSGFPLIERKNLNTLRTDFIETKKTLSGESSKRPLIPKMSLICFHGSEELQQTSKQIKCSLELAVPSTSCIPTTHESGYHKTRVEWHYLSANPKTIQLVRAFFWGNLL